jgi:hypothetical protein
MAIVIDGTGTISGVTSTGLSSAQTVSASNITTGTLPSAQLPTGSILQVVTATYSTSTSIGVNTFTNSGLAASITPTKSSSKIYIVASFMVYVPSAKNLKATISRGSTNLGDATYGMGTVYGSSSGVQSACAISYLDSPATTSSTTYNMAIAAENGTTYICFNGEKASITLFEVAA